jgi:predicted HTH domain antitoxin
MEATITLQLPRRVLESARVNVAELKIELAVHLYQQKRLAIGQARELADMTLWEFRQLLASRRISPHYEVADLDEDMQTWQALSM